MLTLHCDCQLYNSFNKRGRSSCCQQCYKPLAKRTSYSINHHGYKKNCTMTHDTSDKYNKNTQKPQFLHMGHFYGIPNTDYISMLQHVSKPSDRWRLSVSFLIHVTSKMVECVPLTNAGDALLGCSHAPATFSSYRIGMRTGVCY